MGRFVLFGFIAIKHPRRWKGTKLHVRHGLFGQRDIELPSDLRDFIFCRARLVAEKYSQISELQRETIPKSYEQNPDRAAQSDTLRAMHHDVSSARAKITGFEPGATFPAQAPGAEFGPWRRE